MRIKLISPFRTHFNMYSHQYFYDEFIYRKFWDEVSEKYSYSGHDIFTNVTFLHKSIEIDSLRFDSINSDGNIITPEVICIKNDKELSLRIEKIFNEFTTESTEYLKQFVSVIHDSISIKLYDNTIAILVVDIEISNSRCSEFFEKLLVDIQPWSNDFMRLIVKTCYHKLIKLIDLIWDVDSNGGQNIIQHHDKKSFYIDLSEKYESMLDRGLLGVPLWINRTLYIDEVNNDNIEQVYKYWLCVDYNASNNMKYDLMNTHIFLGWGNSIIKSDISIEFDRDAIEALCICQYFNSVLDLANYRLNKLVGASGKRLNKQQTKKLDEELKEVISTVNLLLVHLNETKFNIQGKKQKYFSDLVTRWRLNDISYNIEKKVVFCTEKIDRFYKEESKKNQTGAELLLFSIGGIALVDFFLNIVYFTSDLRANEEMGTTRDGIPGLLDLGNYLSPDAMVWSGFLTLTIFLIIYIIFQTRRN